MEYTRTTDIYQTPFQKATIANQSGADYFVSFHRNSSPIPGQYTGVETLVYDKSGLKYDMAENIAGALGELGFQNLGVKERPGLVGGGGTHSKEEHTKKNQTKKKKNYVD